MRDIVEEKRFVKMVTRYLVRNMNNIDKIIVYENGKMIEILYKNGEKDLVIF
jgi:antitoxin component YwqK of YwqJK toxin-antitoxin module